jgi:hypothetical protein
MNTYSEKPQNIQTKIATHQFKNQQSTVRFVDNRANITTQRKLQSAADNSHASAIIQNKPNNTGLPDNLKSGMENLSGMSLDHVNVHYNSSKPASVQAHAYAQGNDIHLASGQEQHLPHELGHIVQQAQGRVQPTAMVGGMAVNDNPSLENEATAMGNKALQMAPKKGLKNSHGLYLATLQSYQGDKVLTDENSNSCTDGVSQLLAHKIVLSSAKAHYADGWGARYGITSDFQLKAEIRDDDSGSGGINLGWFDGPENEQAPNDRRFQKECTIAYRDAIENDTTAIYHCGPSGPRHWYTP